MSRLLTDAMKDSAPHLLQPLLHQSHRYSITCNKELARVKLFFPFLFQGQIFFGLMLYVVASMYFFPLKCVSYHGRIFIYLDLQFMSVRGDTCSCISKLIQSYGEEGEREFLIQRLTNYYKAINLLNKITKQCFTLGREVMVNVADRK